MVNGGISSGRRASLTRACRSVASCFLSFSDLPVSFSFLVSDLSASASASLGLPGIHVSSRMLLLIHCFLFVWCARYLRPPAVAVVVAVAIASPPASPSATHLLLICASHARYTYQHLQHHPHVHVLSPPRAIQLRLAVAAAVVFNIQRVDPSRVPSLYCYIYVSTDIISLT